VKFSITGFLVMQEVNRAESETNAAIILIFILKEYLT
jgi:hypothetical protein